MDSPNISSSRHNSDSRFSVARKSVPAILQRGEGALETKMPESFIALQAARPNLVAQINIPLLAEELGVDAEYFTYTPEETEIASELFRIFSEKIEDTEVGNTVSMSPELSTIMAETFNRLEYISFLPFFIEIKTSSDELWKKTTFFKFWLLHFFECDCQARIGFLSKFRERFEKGECSESEVKEFIISMCQIDFYGLIVKFFRNQLKDVVENNQYLSWLQDELREIESWHEGFLAHISDDKGRDYVRDLQNGFWSATELPMITFLVQNRGVNVLGDKHFIAYFDRFLCHANTPYFLRFIAEILDESNNYISRIKAWAYARKDLLLAEEENEIQRVFRRIHGIQGRLFHGHRLTDTARSKLPTPLVKIFDSFRSTSSKNVRKRVASSVVESLLGRSSSDTDSHHDMPVVESKTGLSERDKRRQVQEEERKFRRNNSGRRNEPVIIPRDESISISGPASEDPTQNILVHAGSDIRVSSEDPITVELNPVREVREDVAKILAPQQPKENPVKTLEDTVNFWIEALEGGRYTSENRGDVIMLRLKGAYVHRIHDIAFGTITIDTSGIMAPDIGEGDLSSKIHSIVHHLREEKQKEEIENELKEAEKALEGTQTLWGLAIADGDYSYEIGEDGIVLFTLSTHLLDLIHDGTFGTISVAQDGSMSHGFTPELEGQLQILAEKMRVQKQDEAERKEIGEELRPILDILEGDLGITEETIQPTEINTALSQYGALIVLDRDRSVMWLELANGMKIKYFPGGIFHIHTYGQSLSPIRKELYNELGEVLDRIGCILCEKNKEKRKTRITAVQNRRDDVESLFTRIKEGRAYTLLTNDSSYLNGGEFPRSHISGMVQKFHSHKPQTKEEQSTHIILCADSLHFTENLAGNGLNGLELSPWGRQILWERICRTKKDIPLGDALIYTQKKLRGKITGKPKELLDKVLWEGDREAFLDGYIGLLKTNEINVHYGPFVTMKWSEYLREVERRQLKQSEEQPATPTAD